MFLTIVIVGFVLLGVAGALVSIGFACKPFDEMNAAYSPDERRQVRFLTASVFVLAAVPVVVFFSTEVGLVNTLLVALVCVAVALACVAPLPLLARRAARVVEPKSSRRERGARR